MFNINMRVLSLISENKKTTQRSIAKRLNISLGKVNSIIKELELCENIEIINDGKRKIYSITDSGLNIISTDIKIIKDLRVNMHSENSNDVKLAVILAAGKVEEFDKPAGFFKFEDRKVIDRMLDILYKSGIERVVIVSGYKKEYYIKSFKDDSKIINIINYDYEQTGSMFSLAMCNKVINEDFILIENDLIFEEKIIKKIIKNKNKDCVLISEIDKKENQVMVEIKNKKLFKLSKDKRDFNRIDGSFIGITKISKEFYKLMIQELKYNENKFVNYEHIILDISRNYNVGVELVGNLMWREITQ